MRWDYVTDFVVPIADKVLDYSVTPNGRTGALMRSMNVAANGEQLFELSILDFETMQIKPLIEGTSHLYNLSISPDGGWVAYYSQKNGGRLHVIRTDGSNETREVGFCHQPLDQSCEPVSWSPDSLKLLWSDERGIWFTQLDWLKPDLITLNEIEIVDPEGENSTISVDFNSLIWSPSGRYALAEVIPSASIASWYVLIDTRRQRLVEIPNSFQEEVSTTNVSWLLDGSLIVGYSDPDILEPALSIANYEVVPTREDLLLYKDTHILYSEDFPETAAQIEEQNIFLLDWPYHQSTQLLCLGVSTIDSITSPVVFSYDIEMKLLTKVNEVPPITVDVLWSPDASGALVINSRNQVYFTSMNGGELHYLSPIFGEEAEQFTWLPPTPRS